MEIGSKDVDAEAADAGAPRHFFCPISMHIMRDPVMLPTGQSWVVPRGQVHIRKGSNHVTHVVALRACCTNPFLLVQVRTPLHQKMALWRALYLPSNWTEITAKCRIGAECIFAKCDWRMGWKVCTAATGACYSIQLYVLPGQNSAK